MTGNRPKIKAWGVCGAGGLVLGKGPARGPALVPPGIRPAMTVILELAGPDRRATIENLFQLYAHDFSAFAAHPHSPPYTLGEDGRFPPYPYLDQYWRDPGAVALLIRDSGKLAGFALINTHSHRDGGPVERNMAEFFIARPHRRQGIASEAVRLIFADYPGRWEIAIAERNLPAKTFWPRAIAAAPNAGGLEILAGDGVSWRGPIYVFAAR